MKLFDLHCDTAYEMYKQKESLASNDLHIALDRTEKIEEYRQVMAVWSDNALSDEACYEDFLKIHKNFLKHTSLFPEKNKFYLSLEDARLLCGKLERLDSLYDMGIRFLIPMWIGKSIIGGAFDTDSGLTDFGKRVIDRCFELGIVPDISHSSVKSANQIFEIAENHHKPVIASHSCAFSVYEHPRNLRDEQFSRIKASGGVVGLSFCRYHLAMKNEHCGIENILHHIKHYLDIGGENMLCLGADMDGAPMPEGITGIESIPYLYEKLCDSFGKDIADKITFKNAYNFVKTNL